MMNTSTRLSILLAACLGLLVSGNVFADECPNHTAGKTHTINLIVGGAAPQGRHYPALRDPDTQEELHVCHGDRLKIIFPYRPSETKISIRSNEKINQDLAGPPYKYGRANGRTGILINPDPGEAGRAIKYDVIVENSDIEFQDLDPVIIIDTVGPM